MVPSCPFYEVTFWVTIFSFSKSRFRKIRYRTFPFAFLIFTLCIFCNYFFSTGKKKLPCDMPRRHYNNVVSSPDDLAKVLFKIDPDIDDFDTFSRSIRCRSRKRPECIWRLVCRIAHGNVTERTMNKYVRKYYDLFRGKSDAVKAEYVRLQSSALVVPKIEKHSEVRVVTL